MKKDGYLFIILNHFIYKREIKRSKIMKNILIVDSPKILRFFKPFINLIL